MPIEITYTEDPSFVLSEAGEFLAADRVRNNVMIVLLHDRAETGDVGRYWIAKQEGAVRGIVFQSPLNFSALVTPMERDVTAALVDRIAGDGVELPAVGFETQTSTAFAGEWAARTKCAVRPSRAGRQYECFDVIPPAKPASGELRLAKPDERDLMIDWIAEFRGMVGGPDSDVAAGVDRGIARQLIHVWDDQGPVSVAIQSPAVDGFVQVRTVFTPSEHRGKGFASACVAELTSQVLASGDRCLIYTNLNNPTANHIYQQIGYEVVQETLQLDFE